MPSGDPATLLRYVVSGGASALTHLGVGFLLAEGLHGPPVPSSAAGFAASVLVSYGLQRSWVFRSPVGHARAGGRFLTVAAVAGTLNIVILWLGAELLSRPYVLVQAVALVAVPAVNYALNSRWTFRAA
ncbi:GtrA family protein [Actinoplanes sp. M2I2]|uniref:GtrA family protein n=1 Tax=Actinoplanes sp. M2I2 TaxID=1734444 RepID=UPI0020200D04|nr:GtrA family protein [Actinoplanes sp. M2I2]